MKEAENRERERKSGVSSVFFFDSVRL
jgi:hypothetical protein